jgi:hypothetical protein
MIQPNQRFANRIGVSFVSLVLVLSACATEGAGEGEVDQSEAALATGVYNLGAIASPGKCLDVSGAGTANGTNIHEWTCNGTGAQSFRVEDLGGGRARLVNTSSGKCVDVDGARTADGTNIQLWQCNDSGAQSFRIEDAGNSNVRIVNTNSNKCVDVAGSGTADGTNVQLWSCNGTNAQLWRPANIGNPPPPPPPPPPANGNMTFTNRCGETVWVGALSNPGYPLPEGGGFRLDPGQSRGIDLPGNWGGRFWGRTGCNAQGAACATGDCARGTQCGGAGGIPPASLAEFTNVQNGQDFYDVSLVDGYNLPIRITPRQFVRTNPNSPFDCGSPGCTSDLNRSCPAELQKRDGSGRVVACLSACERFGTDAYCCRGANNTPATCPPTNYSRIFKAACPTAYSYAYDDQSSTYTCQANAYDITFCP